MTDKAIVDKCYYCEGEGKLYAGTDLSMGYPVEKYDNCPECYGKGTRLNFI